MRTLYFALVFTIGAATSACAFETIDQHPCPPGGTQLTYANFGATFMNDYCQSCHGSASLHRSGAPGEFIFDTVAQIQAHRDRIYVRSAGPNDSMPPGPADPSAADRARLADWLACGAPP